jgi:predicted benzoate:H+ symporter BenE
MLGREWGCFILCGILGLGAVDMRDIPVRGMLWMLGGVMLKFAQDV